MSQIQSTIISSVHWWSLLFILHSLIFSVYVYLYFLYTALFVLLSH